jgi:hypothetical protein
MLPQSLLQSMLGTEFFRRTADGSQTGGGTGLAVRGLERAEAS